MNTTLLRTRRLTSFYGDFQALFGIDFEIDAGEVVSIIGANGAGKSTFLRSLVGLNKAAGTAIEFGGRPIGGMPPYEIVKQGIALVPEGRRLFPSLTVEENLRLGGHPGRPGPWSLERVYALFPILEERRSSPGTALSGGQQQMVAIGRALMSNPCLLLRDEISLGLSPLIIRDIYGSMPKIVAAGTAVIVVEQDIGQAMRVADRLYCFQEGRVSLAGRSDALTREQISEAYFGSHH
ncbi:ABC transporter ATP-binding protein [Thauera sinica]|uniref:ABC transporter ATP-binding protein n=1 Tax=Thauera sinica TaxID=2665146 RepID=A0ABW1AMQ4_9RHOO|nr:ABC transporter ATP-binding protein [Thauera sp. K11]ATE61653.1 ABC transporter ATP-binding protein [Thauera sp. K11]